MTNAPVPTPGQRKPTTCTNLATKNGNVYCIDTGLNALSFWDGSSWRQTGTLSVSLGSLVVQNSLIAYNGSNTNNLLVPTTTTIGSNGLNIASWSTSNNQYEPAYAGFSAYPTAFASSAN